MQKEKSTYPLQSISQVSGESSICALLLQNGDGSRASAGQIGKEALLVVVVDVNDSVYGYVRRKARAKA